MIVSTIVSPTLLAFMGSTQLALAEPPVASGSPCGITEFTVVEVVGVTVDCVNGVCQNNGSCK